MIARCADIVADWLVRSGTIEEEDKELYSYAAYSIFLSLSPLLLAIGFGLCMGRVKESVVLILPFTIIRKFSGGYHTKNLWTCLICSCFLLILCMVLSMYVKCSWGLALTTLGAAVILMVFSPIENENRILEREEKRQYKRTTIILVAIFLLLNILIFSYHFYTYVVCISLGIVLAAGLQLPCILKHVIKK